MSDHSWGRKVVSLMPHSTQPSMVGWQKLQNKWTSEEEWPKLKKYT